MTAPGNRFGAHQDTTLSARQVCYPLDVVGKLRRLHVIRIAAKRQIAPTGVWRIRSRVAQSSEARKMHIGNFNRVQCCGERVLIELGIVARPRHSPHIKRSDNPIALEQIEECIEWSTGMADRADKRLFGCEVDA